MHLRGTHNDLVFKSVAKVTNDSRRDRNLAPDFDVIHWKTKTSIGIEQWLTSYSTPVYSIAFGNGYRD
ncbi:hypothetical protein NDU88_001162 [Pleurodeles waltl]|uniref:Uncharacterized protein n=1 Tax=Pleurodeles waltl TaxID=8319 RepID=A0AAV7P5U4_PLEWA|nr:hypothetical protein NDU88_001162 [Pleurodeles waltl]